MKTFNFIKKHILSLLIILAVILVIIWIAKPVVTSNGLKEITVTKNRKFTNREANSKCLKCHTTSKYEITDPNDSTKTLFRRLPATCLLDSNRIDNANHWDFKCVDCHSEDYNTVPHNAKLKYATINTCLDCHGDDDTYAKYHFEDIDTSFRKSMHFMKDSMNFNCWSCHDPHYYKIHMRDSLQSIKDVVSYDNAMCLKCHDNNATGNYYEFHASIPKPDLIKVHSWLPALQHHFAQVRCIDCHAKADKEILVGHEIMPKKSSIRNCADCHSSNSRLAKTLYKNRINRAKVYGFKNHLTVSSQDVIGFNRNKYFVLIAFIAFGGLFAFFAIHIVLRIIKRKKHGN